MNRLKLNFKIESAQERADFVKTYLAREEFQLKPPSKKELDTISNYILWGKDENGEKLNVEIERKNQTWSEKKPESIEGLRAVEGFQESDLHPLGDIPIYKIEKANFNRNQVVGTHLAETFNNLFRRIDELDLTINFYDLAHSKRNTPPRKELLQRFTSNEQLYFQKLAETLTEGRYLKLKHELVELRREQYTLRDSFKSTIFRHTNPSRLLSESPQPLLIFPFGLFFNNPTSTLIFQENPNPLTAKPETLQDLSDLIWSFEEKKDSIPSFLQPEFWNFLLDNYRLIENAANEATYDRKILSEVPALKSTIDFYIEIAHLTPIQLRILELKIRGDRNEDIVRKIKKEFQKSYSVNYISTIYRKRIIDTICAAVAQHQKTVNELFWSENFKTCKTCGRVLLKDPFNFTRKQRSSDGFVGSCKRCEKKKKEKKN